MGIVLGGGAARGMAHSGVLQAVEDAGLCVDMVAGTSRGTMVGIIDRSGCSPEFCIQQLSEDLQLQWPFRMIRGSGKWCTLSKSHRGVCDGMLRKYLFDWRLAQ
jgi:predicted acylesterase/phospholipase RssA